MRIEPTRLASRLDFAMSDANRHLEGGSPPNIGVMDEGWVTVTNNVMRHPTSGVHSTGEEPRRPDFAGLEIDDCEFRSWSDLLTCLVICLISAVVTLALICLAVRSVWRWVS